MVKLKHQVSLPALGLHFCLKYESKGLWESDIISTQL